MLAAKSTHKRKRSSARRDASHGASTSAKSIVSLVVPAEEEAGEAAVSLRSLQRLHAVIGSHAYTHELHLLMPTKATVDALPMAADVHAYVARISLCLFLDPLFVTAHIKRGTLTALSVGRLDQDDVFCVDVHGRLHLSLTRDTYQTLGLQGQALKASQTSSGWAGDRKSGAAERYLVTVDLRAAFFTPGRAGWERTMARFRAWDVTRGDANHTGSWDVVMAWSEDDESLGDAIHFPAERFHDAASVRRVDAQRAVTTTEDVWVPVATAGLLHGWSEAQHSSAATSSEWQERLHDLTEWSTLAMLNSDCVRTFSRPDQLNAYEVAVPRMHGAVRHVCYRGFLPASLARAVVRAVKGGDGLQAVVQAVGFADAPVAWVTQRQAPNLLDDDDDEEETGIAARRKRNKKRQQRGHTRTEHDGVQVRSAHSVASTSGWQALLFGGRRRRTALYCN